MSYAARIPRKISPGYALPFPNVAIQFGYTNAKIIIRVTPSGDILANLAGGAFVAADVRDSTNTSIPAKIFAANFFLGFKWIKVDTAPTTGGAGTFSEGPYGTWLKLDVNRDFGFTYPFANGGVTVPVSFASSEGGVVERSMNFNMRNLSG